MGTRGAWGFRYQGEDKLTYNHWDSYPTGLGLDVCKAVRDNDDERLAGTAVRVLIPDEPPTGAAQERYRNLADLGVGERSLDDWYCLLRKAQGRPDLYIAGTYDHLDDASGFMADSLFCEWAYIINCDERVLEIYEGFNGDPTAPGRYASGHRAGSDYYGVVLVETIGFDRLRGLDDSEVLSAMRALEQQDEED